jgi:hypothetical protein
VIVLCPMKKASDLPCPVVEASDYLKNILTLQLGQNSTTLD